MIDRSPEKRPLDDGSRRGPETWRVVEGTEFCHWDRWLLRLSLADVGGLPAIERELRRRRRNKKLSIHAAAEALLAQVVDLRARLAQTARTPETLLDAEERASDWLFKKAFKRVWHDGPHHKTAAMMDTPRRRLERRALRGHWGEFPVSPSCFEPALLRIIGTDGHVHWAMIGTVSRMLDIEIDSLVRATGSDMERLALHRAAMTVILELSARSEDSMGDLGELFHGSEEAYYPLVLGAFVDGVLLRDLLELSIWEDYGLFRDFEGFLASLPEECADLAMRELSSIIAELRREEIDYQLEKARVFRAALLGATKGLLPEGDD